jgi:hypothetical protein
MKDYYCTELNKNKYSKQSRECRKIQDNKLKALVEKKWRGTLLGNKKKFSSHVPEWVMDPENNKLYLVFDRKYRYEARITNLTTLPTPSSLYAISKSYEGIINITEEKWRDANVSKPSDNQVVILLTRSYQSIIFTLAEIKFAGIKSEQKISKENFYDQLLESSIKESDFRTIRKCYPKISYRKGYEYNCYTHYHYFNETERQETNKQLSAYTSVLSAILHFNAGSYSLMRSTSLLSKYESEYNAKLVAHLHNRKVIFSNAIERLNNESIFIKLQKNWPIKPKATILFFIILLACISLLLSHFFRKKIPNKNEYTSTTKFKKLNQSPRFSTIFVISTVVCIFFLFSIPGSFYGAEIIVYLILGPFIGLIFSIFIWLILYAIKKRTA